VPWSELRVADAVAWQGLSARWGLSASAVLAPCPSEADTGLLCYRSMNGNLGQIRELDRPTALRLRPPGGAPQWMLLLALDNQSATLQLSGRNVRLPLSQLAEAWRGEFLLWWRAPALGQRGEQRAAGLRNETEVRAFQVAHGLQPDGRAGPLTGMLFNRFAGVEEPHLTASP
jgi:general secretion pathway protein A